MRLNESIYRASYTRNKRGITCALDRPEGRELILKLVERADFVFESGKPGGNGRVGTSGTRIFKR